MKLWQKDITLDQQIEQFTIGKDQELDLQLASFDVLGSLAHIQMLEKIDLLTKAELSLLQGELQSIYMDIQAGEFQIEVGIEDIHSQIEYLLTARLGEVGKKIHAGRSRNDQVLVDLRLFFRSEIKAVAELLHQVIQLLLKKSEASKNVLMPGYTHTQIGMLSSFGMWFGAFAESLIDDLHLLQSTYDIINQNPLGSAAGYGSSFPLDRQLTTELLGFRDLNYNAMHAQMGRGKSELLLAFSLSAIGSTLNKLASDICLFSNQNFGFFELPEAFTTGSSIMPHKKNPDVFELIRAKCNQLQSLPTQVSMLTTNLISGYHRDFQLLKEQLFPALQSMKACLSTAHLALSQIQINPQILEDEKYNYLYSVEVVNAEVLNGMPFRDAYQKVGKSIAEGTFVKPDTVQHTHLGSIGNLGTAHIQSKLDALWKNFEFEILDLKLKLLLQ